jgi:hypothetical protein
MAREKAAARDWIKWLGFACTVLGTLYAVVGIPPLKHLLDVSNGDDSRVAQTQSRPTLGRPVESKWDRFLNFMSKKHYFLADPRDGALTRTESGLLLEAKMDDFEFFFDQCYRAGSNVRCSVSVRNEGLNEKTLELRCGGDSADKQVKLVDSVGLVHVASDCSIGGRRALSLDPKVAYRMSADFTDVDPKAAEVRHLRFEFGSGNHVSFHDIPITRQ